MFAREDRPLGIVVEIHVRVCRRDPVSLRARRRDEGPLPRGWHAFRYSGKRGKKRKVTKINSWVQTPSGGLGFFHVKSWGRKSLVCGKPTLIRRNITGKAPEIRGGGVPLKVQKQKLVFNIWPSRRFLKVQAEVWGQDFYTPPSLYAPPPLGGYFQGGGVQFSPPNV